MPEPRYYVQHRSSLMMLVGWIPGFHGYLEREYRRDSDALQRTWLTDRLQRSKRAMDAVALKLADAGKLAALPQCDRLRAKTDELIARIRGAWEGYTGVFDLVKVDQTLLDRVYDHDVNLMHAVDEFVAMTEHLAGLPPSGDMLKPPATATATAAATAAPASAPNPAAATGATPSVAPAAVPPPLGASAASAPVPPAANSVPPTAQPDEPPWAALPADPEAAIPILATKLDAIQQSCDQRAELLKGLG